MLILKSPFSSFLFFAIISAPLLSACGSDDSSNSTNDTQGNVTFRATLTTHWNRTDFPTQYPSGAHWSSPIGTVHNEQVIFWRKNNLPASNGIEVMAESGGTEPFSVEVEAARDNGYSQGLIKMNNISGGSGSSSIEFATFDSFTLFTLVSMIAPSPDWFVGVDSIDLRPNGEWIDSLEIQLPLYDAGTDAGLTFNSANIDTSTQDLAINRVTSARSDSDFENGIHYNTEQYVATLVIERIE